MGNRLWRFVPANRHRSDDDGDGYDHQSGNQQHERQGS
jgi:hypothetical protein